jgi:hypothetical protein
MTTIAVMGGVQGWSCADQVARGNRDRWGPVPDEQRGQLGGLLPVPPRFRTGPSGKMRRNHMLSVMLSCHGIYCAIV